MDKYACLQDVLLYTQLVAVSRFVSTDWDILALYASKVSEVGVRKHRSELLLHFCEHLLMNNSEGFDETNCVCASWVGAWDLGP